MFATSCWRDAFICVLCLLSVAIVCAVRFAILLMDSSCEFVQCTVVRIFVCCKACKGATLGVPTLH